MIFSYAKDMPLDISGFCSYGNKTMINTSHKVDQKYVESFEL